MCVYGRGSSVRVCVWGGGGGGGGALNVYVRKATLGGKRDGRVRVWRGKATGTEGRRAGGFWFYGGTDGRFGQMTRPRVAFGVQCAQ